MKKVVKILLIIFLCSIFSINEIKAKELPKIYFEGDINNMDTKEDERKIKLTYKSNDTNFNAYATIKIQGASSLKYQKKNYTIKLYNDKEYTNKKKVDIGFGSESKYCLKANWVDFTHSRNIVTARIMSSIQNKYNLFKDTPNNGLIDGFPIEIYINNEFLGLYTLNIPKDEWMFNMDKNNPNHIVLSGQKYSTSTEFNSPATYGDWEVEIGPETDETLNKFNRLSQFIMNSSDEEFKTNFQDYLNLDATLNYYVMLNVGQLFDNTAKNLLMVTYDGNIWYPSLYDLDTSWGVNWNGTTTYAYDSNILENNNSNLLWTKFERNFNNEIANRYFELRKDILTKENILNEFKSFINNIPTETLKKESNRWNNIPGYALNQIEEFLIIRIPLIDEYMYNLYDITPSLTISYSSINPSIFPIKVTITPNRNDIKILKDNIPTTDNTLKINNNGKYTIKYQDSKGIIYSTTIKIDWIIRDKILNLFIPILIIITIIISLNYTNKKKLVIKDNETKEIKEQKKNNKETKISNKTKNTPQTNIKERKNNQTKPNKNNNSNKNNISKKPKNSIKK